MERDGKYILQTQSGREFRVNGSAALVLQCCDGTRSVKEILQLITARFSETAESLVREHALECLRQFLDIGLIRERPPENNNWGSPLLISGAARSGSSALTHFLSTHKRICLFNEYELYNDNGRSTNAFEKLLTMDRNQPPGKVAESKETLIKDLRSDLPLPASNRLLRDWLFEKCNPSPILYGDKLPSVYIYKMYSIKKEIPRVRFLITIRDGRSVVTSALRNFKDAHTRNKKPAPWAAATVQEAESLWLRPVSEWLTLRDNPPAPCLEVRYEKAVLDPAATAKRICEFTGLDYNENEFKEFVKCYKPVNTDTWRNEIPDIESQLSGNFLDTLNNLGYH